MVCLNMLLLHGSLKKKKKKAFLFYSCKMSTILSFPQNVYYTNIHKVIADVLPMCYPMCKLSGSVSLPSSKEYVIF